MWNDCNSINERINPKSYDSGKKLRFMIKKNGKSPQSIGSNILIKAYLEWNPNKVVSMTFCKKPSVGEIIKYLIQERYITSPDINQFGVLNYSSNDIIEDNYVLITRNNSLCENKIRVINYLFPLLFWISVYIPIYLFRHNFPSYIVMIGIIISLNFIGTIGEVFGISSIFFFKENRSTLSHSELLFIIFCSNILPLKQLLLCLDGSDSKGSTSRPTSSSRIPTFLEGCREASDEDKQFLF